MIGTNSEIVRLRELINGLYSLGQMRLVTGWSDGEMIASLKLIEDRAKEIARTAGQVGKGARDQS